MKVLGVIGGLGPQATAYFLELLTALNDVKTDQEHMEVLVYSKPNTPDRTKYILGLSDESPVPVMSEVGRTLKKMGAEIIAVPCITAHYFHDILEQEIGLPIINAIEETTRYFDMRKITKIGILATDGTMKSGLFQRAMEKLGIEYVLPDKEGQKIIMNIIYDNVKAGKSVDMDAFQRVTDSMFEKGVEKVLLACTELSVIKKDYGLGQEYVDILEILAMTSLQKCGYSCREK